MAREDLHFRLRIPEALKQQVAEAAEKQGHSMTAEIIRRLTWTFEDPSYELMGPDSPEGTASRVPLSEPSELQQIQQALWLERSMYGTAIEWLEERPGDQKAKDAVEMSELRIDQLERRLRNLKAHSLD